MSENLNWKCKCEGKEEYGDYSRMIVFKFEGKQYQVDSCLEEEIKYLLSKGIRTIESCCGHKNTEGGYIAVAYEDIKSMESLGYEHYINPNHPEAEEFFIPKTK